MCELSSFGNFSTQDFKDTSGGKFRWFTSQISSLDERGRKLRGLNLKLSLLSFLCLNFWSCEQDNRRRMNEKISELNSAIDNVAAQLKTDVPNAIDDYSDTALP